MSAVQKRQFQFAAGSNVSVGIVNNADGTQTVTISATGASLQLINPTASPGISGGAGQTIGAADPETWVQDTNTGFWVPEWHTGS
jgi:hypothetical protein